MIDAIQAKYGFKQGLDIEGDNIVKWPYDEPFPTLEEMADLMEDEPKQIALKFAERLYRQIKESKIIKVDLGDGEKVFDLTDNFEFDWQRKNLSEIRLKPMRGATIKGKTKAMTDALETALFTHLSSVADAFDSDIVLIESGSDLTCPNLNAIKDAQETLKAE